MGSVRALDDNGSGDNSHDRGGRLRPTSSLPVLLVRTGSYGEPAAPAASCENVCAMTASV